MWCVVVVFAVADASISVVNGTDNLAPVVMAMTRVGGTVRGISTGFRSDGGMWMWCVVVVFAVTDASISVVNGADYVSVMTMTGVGRTFSGIGTGFRSDCRMWMWCVVVVFAVADASISVVNGADYVSVMTMTGVGRTFSGIGA
jgi:hypothetical protein